MPREWQSLTHASSSKQAASRVRVVERAETASERKRKGLLVPVANPEGVAPLIAIALAASRTGDPPPRVLAMVNRAAGDSSTPTQAQEGVAPSSGALVSAVEYARLRGATVETEAMWSENPAADIVAAARAAGIDWVLLGYHRAESGSDTMGGVVQQIFDGARGLPINVGVFIQGTDRPIERVFAAVDGGPDGRAALDLAARIAQTQKCRLRALLVSGRMPQPEPEDDLVELIHEARKKMGRRLHTDVLSERSLSQLFKQTPGRLLIVGKKFADEVHFPLNETPEGDRYVIVVQGSEGES